MCFCTVSSSLHLFQRRLPKCLVSQLQLVSEPAQIPFCFGPDDAQLGVNVLVLIRCIFLVLNKKTHTHIVWKFRRRLRILVRFSQRGIRRCPLANKTSSGRSYLNANGTYSLGCLQFIFQRIDFLLQVLDFRLLHSKHHLENKRRKKM